MALRVPGPRDADRRTDPADVTVLLAAEAAVLEGRLGVLRKAIAERDARIHAVGSVQRAREALMPGTGPAAASSP
ncbi:hypothetical protein [Streptomyces sp. TLI_55]|uniref:hypothetical protein n=1 Tax=Streptomyces sp. TLI_55 TaxID=1938861 RepID=UPI000BE309A5|nr:hypothetical protein [Streptomyces sp. TLI_55]